MRRYTGAMFYLFGGLLAGTVSAYAVIQHAGVERVTAKGPWQSRAAALDGSTGIYAQSFYLLSGRLPLAGGQFIEASADTDGENAALSSACVYDIVSTGPLASWWSLAAAAEGGAALSLQETLDSTTAIAEPSGTTRITASAIPQPGNWLKIPATRHFSLLYAGLPSGSRASGSAPPFSITRKGC